MSSVLAFFANLRRACMGANVLGQGHSLHAPIETKNTRVAPGTCYDRAASAAQLKPWGRMTEPTSNSAPRADVARRSRSLRRP